MRSLLSHCVLFALVASCGGQAAPTAAVPASDCAPAPVASAEPVKNGTNLRAEVLDSPLSAASLYFAAPELGVHLLDGDPRNYRVHVISAAGGSELIGIDLALDTGRPRRVSLAEPSIALGKLLSEDATLAPGAHWLFAAPVLASGLVPRAASGGPRAAKARRFFIGNTPDEAAGPSGAVWLRKPEGNYNGAKGSESVLFDAFVFSALGVPLDIPCTISLRAPAASGPLLLASPFVVHDIPSGVYEVSVSASIASTSTAYFTVNRELAGGS
ncbi:MAG TPA: hypothetical protein VGC79_11960 [Polyangiaceae bacterium]